MNLNISSGSFYKANFYSYFRSLLVLYSWFPLQPRLLKYSNILSSLFRQTVKWWSFKKIIMCLSCYNSCSFICSSSERIGIISKSSESWIPIFINTISYPKVNASCSSSESPHSDSNSKLSSPFPSSFNSYYNSSTCLLKCGLNSLYINRSLLSGFFSFSSFVLSFNPQSYFTCLVLSNYIYLGLNSISGWVIL